MRGIPHKWNCSVNPLLFQVQGWKQFSAKPFLKPMILPWLCALLTFSSAHKASHAGITNLSETFLLAEGLRGRTMSSGPLAGRPSFPDTLGTEKLLLHLHFYMEKVILHFSGFCFVFCKMEKPISPS